MKIRQGQLITFTNLQAERLSQTTSRVTAYQPYRVRWITSPDEFVIHDDRGIPLYLHHSLCEYIPFTAIEWTKYED